MTIDNKCDHKEIFYMPRPHDEVLLYQCNACKTTTLRNLQLGGTIDMRQYRAEVLAYNGLRMVKNG